MEYGYFLVPNLTGVLGSAARLTIVSQGRLMPHMPRALPHAYFVSSKIRSVTVTATFTYGYMMIPLLCTANTSPQPPIVGVEPPIIPDLLPRYNR